MTKEKEVANVKTEKHNPTGKTFIKFLGNI